MKNPASIISKTIFCHTDFPLKFWKGALMMRLWRGQERWQSRPGKHEDHLEGTRASLWTHTGPVPSPSPIQTWQISTQTATWLHYSAQAQLSSFWGFPSLAFRCPKIPLSGVSLWIHWLMTVIKAYSDGSNDFRKPAALDVFNVASYCLSHIHFWFSLITLTSKHFSFFFLTS